MRFLAHGPDIPSDLLYGRDAGDVIFFCGAGVSRAEAGGPSFRELAERVVADLGSARGSAARQLLELSRELKAPPGVGGMPPADRIFALLEQEFAVADVRSSVARAVRPRADAGLGPHAALLDLSTVASGATRLVTTNFDRVFQLARPGLEELLPPNLIDPRASQPWRGIVHLHGMVTPDYEGAAQGEFVLSSADFGRAYLADGWATTFMRGLMERYRIVFVGYSADDPPIQYLLEALSPTARPGRLYAFHAGGADEAAALWRHKGVEAIPFSGFESLWASLAAWATRARDPAAWRASVLDLARRGPRALTPMERGQVAHLVSGEAGAQEFASADPPPPAEWLCAFDPQVRYDGDRSFTLLDGEAERLRPFDEYGLDGDTQPLAARSPTHGSVPTCAWSALDALPSDVRNSSAFIGGSLRGPAGTDPPQLPARLAALSNWFGRIVDSGVAVWWAAGQRGIHPSVVESVRRNLGEQIEPVILEAWRFTLSAMRPRASSDHEIYELERVVAREGWSAWSLSELERIQHPYLTVSRPYTSPPIGPSAGRSALVHGGVVYPGGIIGLAVPDYFLARYVRTLRRYLEEAKKMELEAKGFFLAFLQPIVPFEDSEQSFSGRADDLAALVVRMAQHVERLENFDPPAASREVSTWPASDSGPFLLLRSWAAGREQLMPDRQAGRFFVGLSDDAFWNSEAQRDLLVSIAKRWPRLARSTQLLLVRRIAKGPSPWEGIDPVDFARNRAHRILSRLEWLEREALEIPANLAKIRTRLLMVVPGWTTADADDEIYRSRSRGGVVAMVTDPGDLVDLPIAEVLAASDAVSGRRRDFLVEHRPFRGLAEQRPVRALRSLIRAAERGEIRNTEWSDFLWHEARAKDSPHLRVLIAERLIEIPDAVMRGNLQSSTQWIKTCGDSLYSRSRRSYLGLWERLVGMVATSHEESKSGIADETGREWLSEAINAPGGRLSQVLCDELSWAGPDRGVMSGPWRRRAELLLSMQARPRSHVGAVFGSRLNWLYHTEPEWCEAWLLAPCEADLGADFSKALVSALLSFGGNWSLKLFVRLKHVLIRLAAGSLGTERGNHAVSNALLVGWNSKDVQGHRLVSDEEMREILLSIEDGPRVQVLRMLGHWTKADASWDRFIAFVEHVWPKQLIARTPAAAAILAELAMSAGDRLPAVTRAVLPLLSPAGDGWADAVRFRGTKDDGVESYPEEHLAILYAAAGAEPRLWAYGTVELIERLSKTRLRDDPRLGDLRRRITRG